MDKHILADHAPLVFAAWQSRGGKRWLYAYQGENRHGRFIGYRGDGCSGCYGDIEQAEAIKKLERTSLDFWPVKAHRVK